MRDNPFREPDLLDPLLAAELSEVEAWQQSNSVDTGRLSTAGLVEAVSRAVAHQPEAAINALGEKLWNQLEGCHKGYLKMVGAWDESPFVQPGSFPRPDLAAFMTTAGNLINSWRRDDTINWMVDYQQRNGGEYQFVALPNIPKDAISGALTLGSRLPGVQLDDQRNVHAGWEKVDLTGSVMSKPGYRLGVAYVAPRGKPDTFLDEAKITATVDSPEATVLEALAYYAAREAGGTDVRGSLSHLGLPTIHNTRADGQPYQLIFFSQSKRILLRDADPLFAAATDTLHILSTRETVYV